MNFKIKEELFNFSSSQTKKIEKAIELLERVVNTQGFKDLVYKIVKSSVRKKLMDNLVLLHRIKSSLKA